MKSKLFNILIFVMFSTSIWGQNSSSKNYLYPNIEKGRYDVGFQTIIDLDYSRTYNWNYPNDTNSHIKHPRPIITNIWYPALSSKKNKKMLYGDYIKFKTKVLSLKTFLERIEKYNIMNSSYYMFYKDSLNDDEEKQFMNHLNEPISVFKNAQPIKDKFPLVIYHAGLGGTLNDNTILCEYLASNGYVVISGAFQSNDYLEVELDWDLERSTKDINFMLNTVKNLPFINFSKIAAIGHSYGAQAILGYKTEDFSPVNCLISLDNTFDYSFDENPEGFEPLTLKFYDKIKNMNVPTLVFAGPQASFKVMDSLKFSDRIYATIELGHNDYISLSSYASHKGLQIRIDKDSTWEKYRQINEHCLNFLNYTLCGDFASKKKVLTKSQFIKEVIEIPTGKTLSKKIIEYSDFSIPPNYFEIKLLLKNKAMEKIDKLIHLYPYLFEEDFLNNEGYIAMSKDIDFAIYLFQKNVDLYPESWNAFDSLGEAYYVKGQKDLAKINYSKSLELNPNNEGAKKILEKLN